MTRYTDKMNRKRLLGISLMEIMLSLTIIAFILILGTRYYETTQQSQKVASTITQVNAIIAGLDQYFSSNGSFSSLSSSSSDAWDQLRVRGYLPASMGKEETGNPVSPFGTNYILNKEHANEVTVQFSAGEKGCLAIEDNYGVSDTSDLDTNYFIVECNDDTVTVTLKQ